MPVVHKIVISRETPELQKYLFIGCLVEGLSLSEIGKHINLDKAGISRRMKKLGLKIQDYKNKVIDNKPENRCVGAENCDKKNFERIMVNDYQNDIPLIIRKTAELMEYYKKKHLNVSLNDAKAILKESGLLGREVDNIPRYIRPKFLNAKQNEIIDQIVSGKYKIIMIEGDQRTGKTTLIYIALCELILKRYPLTTQIDLMAGKGDQAKRILQDLTSDLLLKDINADLLKTVLPSGAYVKWFNDSKVDAHETTVNDIKGSDSNVIWIEELDRAVLKDPQAVMSALFTLRARTDLLVVMSANMDKGAYLMIREV